MYRQLDEIQKDANRQVYAKVLEVNNYARDIRDLNERILKSEALGDNPNDLKDRRDALIDKLSEIVNISVGRSDKDELIVYISGENLVQGEVLHELQTIANPDKKGFYDVTWKKTGAKVYHEAGSLSGLIDVRDKILQDNLNNINSLAVNIVDLTNEVHRDGFGKNGETNINFFKEMTVSDNVEGNFDLNNDGYLDTTAIFKVAGKNKVDASAAIGITGTLTIVTNDELEASVPVDYTATDTVMSVMKKINDAKLGVSAYINHDGQLAIKATIAKDNESKNFMIRHLEDSGQFLVGLTGILKESGPNGAFNYNKINDIAKFLPDRESITIAPRHNPASYMAISKEVEINIDRIAASRGKDIGGTGDYNTTNGIGDGSNALGIANLRHKAAMVENNATFSDFYTSLISKIGSQGQEADDRVKNQETMLSNLGNLRESFSGINLDEEMANMVAFQHAYNANARMISTVDKMLETIIRLGS